MAKIHGLVYIMVGLFVSILSWNLDYEKLIFFFYAGIVFLFLGIAKLGFDFIKRRKTNLENQHLKMRHQAVHGTRQAGYCTKCGSASRLHDRFCSRCGSRI